MIKMAGGDIYSGFLAFRTEVLVGDSILLGFSAFSMGFGVRGW